MFYGISDDVTEIYFIAIENRLVVIYFNNFELC